MVAILPFPRTARPARRRPLRSRPPVLVRFPRQPDPVKVILHPIGDQSTVIVRHWRSDEVGQCRLCHWCRTYQRPGSSVATCGVIARGEGFTEETAAKYRG